MYWETDRYYQEYFCRAPQWHVIVHQGSAIMDPFCLKGSVVHDTSYNQKMVRVGMELTAHPAPAPAMCRDASQQLRPPRAAPSLTLSACRDGAPTALRAA